MFSYSVMSDSLQPHGLYVVHQALLSMGFSGQEHWSGLPFPSPGNLLDPEIKPMSLMSPALAGRFFTTEPPGKPHLMYTRPIIPGALVINIPITHVLMGETPKNCRRTRYSFTLVSLAIIPCVEMESAQFIKWVNKYE